MNRLRNRLIAVFLAATLLPLAATWWIAATLLERSLSYSSADQVDELSRTLEKTGRELYQRSRQALKADAAAGRLVPSRYSASQLSSWPPLQEFWQSGEDERFLLSDEDAGERLNYLVRREPGVWVYSRLQGGVGLGRLSAQYRQARTLVDEARTRDLRRGFLTTLLVLGAGVWLIGLSALTIMAHRISRPIQQLTAGLGQLAAGDLRARVRVTRDDEIGKAIAAFNEMAAQLQHSRERLVYLTRLGSWQALARKTAHELKNSLTPIRLTMEEIAARGTDSDPAFLEQAAHIVVDEVEGLERRVRAFSELSSEPPVRPVPLNLNALLEERVALLRPAYPGVVYDLALADSKPVALADEDLTKGILTNLLENAAEAAGPGGRVLAITRAADGEAWVEVHDSGPGLSETARRSLFEPTISFKKGGMGLGLSIARKNALLSGGDIVLVDGELGGAAFRVSLPLAL